MAGTQLVLHGACRACPSKFAGPTALGVLDLEYEYMFLQFLEESLGNPTSDIMQAMRIDTWQA